MQFILHAVLSYSRFMIINNMLSEEKKLQYELD